MDKLSYSLGLGIGQQLKQMGLKDNLKVEDFAASITDVLNDNPLKVSHQEGQQIVNAFFQQLEQKQNAAKAEAGMPRRQASVSPRAVFNMKCSPKAQASNPKPPTPYVVTTKDVSSTAPSSTPATSATNPPTSAYSKSLPVGQKECSSCPKAPNSVSTSPTCSPMAREEQVLPSHHSPRSSSMWN